ncbi:DUF2933 domain-containing protein [Paenibacillus sp. MMO-177]|uniref:DUF2933 domain-containing protein n=1 Tax=Paenibacillus sp. MMO-177 TaxID=3081289 RepID=UPI0030164278
MQWLSILAVFACPLMMLFCMKGMFSGHKHSSAKKDCHNSSNQNVQSLQLKMAELMEQNHKLTKEIENLKQASNTAESHGANHSAHVMN